jgi:uncharacterized membrane protein (UPF0127 family)
MQIKYRKVKVILVKNQAPVAEECSVAESFLTRAKGLIGSAELRVGQGMLFNSCNNIHMWFMSFPIDLIFLNDRTERQGSTYYRVSSFRVAIQPWSLLPFWDRRATDVLELPRGSIQRCDLKPGDEICIN